jgi:hypothetical protein
MTQESPKEKRLRDAEPKSKTKPNLALFVIIAVAVVYAIIRAIVYFTGGE